MLPIHLILVSIIPLLFLVSHNISIISLPDTFLPFVVLVVTAITLQIVISFFLKNKLKSALIVSWLYLLFFSYGHVHGFLNQIMGSDISETIIKNRFLIPIWGVFIILGGFWIIKTKKTLEGLTKFVNIWSITMASISLFNIALYVFGENNIPRSKLSNLKINHVDVGILKKMPDIYYFSFDAYANEQTLKETFNYDNSPFLNFLKKKGFYVASRSRSNYAETLLSLTSSLNMDYVNAKYLPTQNVGKKAYSQLKILLENNKVVHLLKDQGYQFIHLPAGWGAALKNRNANIEIKCDQTDEVLSILIKASLYFPFEKKFKFIGNDRRQQILCMFDRLGEVANAPSPKFVFGNFMVPHFPYDFGLNGEPANHINSKESYLKQLIFTNKKIMAMVDKILEASDSQPIIILQSDHGPTTPYLKTNPRKPDNDDQFKRDRIRNFSAYLLPGKGNKTLYQTISPVNTFRVIFNLYFNADYKILEDKSYFSWYPDEEGYHMEEIDPYPSLQNKNPLQEPHPIQNKQLFN
jgi:hypothetical protein